MTCRSSPTLRRALYRILRAAYDGGTAKEAMVLDSALRVVSGGLSAGKTAYTQRELDYLLGRASEQSPLPL